MNMIDGVLLWWTCGRPAGADTLRACAKALEAGPSPSWGHQTKIDRENSNPKKVLDRSVRAVSESLGARMTLDFPFIYCKRQGGYAKVERPRQRHDEPLF